MTNLHFIIVALLFLAFGTSLLWLALRSVVAEESIAKTLANLHAAEIAGMAEVFREERERAGLRTRAGLAHSAKVEGMARDPEPIRVARFGGKDAARVGAGVE